MSSEKNILALHDGAVEVVERIKRLVTALRGYALGVPLSPSMEQGVKDTADPIMEELDRLSDRLRKIVEVCSEDASQALSKQDNVTNLIRRAVDMSLRSQRSYIDHVLDRVEAKRKANVTAIASALDAMHRSHQTLANAVLEMTASFKELKEIAEAGDDPTPRRPNAREKSGRSLTEAALEGLRPTFGFPGEGDSKGVRPNVPTGVPVRGPSQLDRVHLLHLHNLPVDVRTVASQAAAQHITEKVVEALKLEVDCPCDACSAERARYGR